MSSKLTVGCKARWKYEAYSDRWVSPGKIVTVTGINRFGCILPDGKVDSSEYNAGYSPDNFEVISVVGEQPTGESELETLVRKANEGYRAEETIRDKYRDKVEMRSGIYNGRFTPVAGPADVSSNLRNREIRLLSNKPVFEPFRVGEWDVLLTDGTLHIGCKAFSAKEFIAGAQKAQQLDTGSVIPMLNGCQLLPSRRGLFWNGYTLSWADADKILAALEKAGVK